MTIIEQFRQSALPRGFAWFNPPLSYRVGDGLEIFTGEKTDFWQRTHYEFQRDDGHFLFTRQTGDFSLAARVEFDPREKYDQAGLMVRIDAGNWIKVSTEYHNEQVSRLGSVVTNLGYSDWATQDISSAHRALWYRVQKWGRDFLLEHSFDGQAWSQMRIAHLHRKPRSYAVGVYACSPIGKDFHCRFTTLEIGDSQWQGPEPE